MKQSATQPHDRVWAPFPDGCPTDPALAEPLAWRAPTRVLVDAKSDLFHEDVPFDFIDKVFAAMALCPQHTFQVLTKRPERMAEYVDAFALSIEPRCGGWHPLICDAFEIERRLCPGGVPKRGPYEIQCDLTKLGWPLPNVHLGTNIENQETADERIPHLLRCPAAVRFLSCEPLLGAVSLDTPICDSCGNRGADIYPEGPSGAWCRDCETETPFHDWLDGEPRIHWVIAGGESGKGARPMHPDWVRSLRDQCSAAGVPFFFKQWGSWAQEKMPPGTNVVIEDPRERLAVWPDGTIGSGSFPLNGGSGYGMIRVGKKAAGRTLDDRTWDEMPGVIP